MPVAEFSVPTKNGEYLIDRDELLQLKEKNLISIKLYVYLALKLSYNTSSPSVDIPSFCEQWQLEEAEFATAIAQLHKKKVLQPVHRQLELELL